ncbi:MAG: heparan-alpha-glucosaminide N-acetyltransferase domain-containing protein [Promethearchaeota archaeon]
MRRLKTIDILRGLSMLWMFLGHLLDWWLLYNDRLLYTTAFSLFDVIGAGAFILVSGISTTLSYRTRLKKLEHLGANSKRIVRNEYLLRASLILIVSIIYNIPIALYTLNVFNVWIWYVLLTIAVSLFLGRPFLRTNKFLRIIAAIGIIVANQVFISFIHSHEGEANGLGFIFHIFYNGYPIMDPLLTFFPFFLVGSALGDLIHDIYLIENKNMRRIRIKNHILYPFSALGIALVVIGVTYSYPDFLNAVVRSFSFILYSLGFQMILFSFLLLIEEFELIKTKKSYRFLYYFSYYSLSIFLIHNLLYFVFYHQLSASIVLFFIAGTVVLVWLLLKFIHKKFGKKVSLKALISRLAVEGARRIEMRSRNKAI